LRDIVVSGKVLPWRAAGLMGVIGHIWVLCEVQWRDAGGPWVHGPRLRRCDAAPACVQLRTGDAPSEATESDAVAANRARVRHSWNLLCRSCP